MGRISEDFARLAKEIVDSYEERLQTLSDIAVDTQNILEGFARENQKRAKDTQDFLKKSETNRLKEFNPFMESIQLEVEASAKDTQDFLKRTAKENQKSAKDTQDFLEKSETDRLKEFKPFMKSIQLEVAEAAKAWASLVSFVKSKKQGVKPEVGVVRKVAKKEKPTVVEKSVKPTEKAKIEKLKREIKAADTAKIVKTTKKKVGKIAKGGKGKKKSKKKR